MTRSPIEFPISTEWLLLRPLTPDDVDPDPLGTQPAGRRIAYGRPHLLYRAAHPPEVRPIRVFSGTDRLTTGRGRPPRSNHRSELPCPRGHPRWRSTILALPVPVALRQG